MKHLLEVDSVILEFNKRRILQDVYLSCETGSVTGLLGLNGSGKSCLMNIIYGELTPIDKSVRINGKALLSNNRSQKDMCYLPQFNFIPKSLKVYSILFFFNQSPSDFLLEFPEFSPFMNIRINQLSGGQQRIIELYVVLCSPSKFCILDEPFTHIMPLHVEKIKQLIVKEKKHKGILISDHLYESILEVSDTLFVIKDGKTYLTKSNEDIETLGYARLK